CSIGRELERVDVVALEVTVVQRADMENADRGAVDDQRDAEHRLDPLLPQKRIEDVGVVDVVEDHRTALRRDTSRKAKADRDANAGLDLFLRSEEHTSELQSLAYLVCRLLLEKKKHKLKY